MAADCIPSIMKKIYLKVPHYDHIHIFFNSKTITHSLMRILTVRASLKGHVSLFSAVHLSMRKKCVQAQGNLNIYFPFTFFLSLYLLYSNNTLSSKHRIFSFSVLNQWSFKWAGKNKWTMRKLFRSLYKAMPGTGCESRWSF